MLWGGAGRGGELGGTGGYSEMGGTVAPEEKLAAVQPGFRLLSYGTGDFSATELSTFRVAGLSEDERHAPGMQAGGSPSPPNEAPCRPPRLQRPPHHPHPRCPRKREC